MAKSTAQRQAAYRQNIAATHKRVEIILDQAVYQKLQTLVEKSDYRTRIDYLTALIEKEHQALSGYSSLPDNKLSPDPFEELPALLVNSQKKTVSRQRPAKKKPIKVIDLWQDEQRCQGQTARGTRCRIGYHLSVIKFRSGKKTYEVLTCKQHFDHFQLHDSVLK